MGGIAVHRLIVERALRCLSLRIHDAAWVRDSEGKECKIYEPPFL